MTDPDPIKCKICGAPSDGKCLYADPLGPKPPEDCRVRQIARSLASEMFPDGATTVVHVDTAEDAFNVLRCWPPKKPV